jgi:transcriptional regulator NrdR family protein
MLYIVKRDGTEVPFDKDKIIKAINGAFIEVDGQLYEDDTAKDIAKDIENTLELLNHTTTVERI